MDKLKYPIGRFTFDQSAAKIQIPKLIEVLDSLPANVKARVENLNDTELENRYRPDGWTVRQVVHHLSDSHANMYIRVKSAMTNSGTAIMGYDEAAWAKFPDNELPVTVSLQMISSLHQKLTHLFRQFTSEDWVKSYFHNGEQRHFSLLEVLALYAWHSRHHLAHIDIAIAT